MLEMIDRLITERGSAAILKERLELLKDQASVMEDKLELLQRSNAQLTAENAALKAEVAKKSSEPDFIEAYGALFKRRPDGSLYKGIYCPMHKVPASSIGEAGPFFCPDSDCGWVTNITPSRLPLILTELER